MGWSRLLGLKGDWIIPLLHLYPEQDKNQQQRKQACFAHSHAQVWELMRKTFMNLHVAITRSNKHEATSAHHQAWCSYTMFLLQADAHRKDVEKYLLEMVLKSSLAVTMCTQQLKKTFVFKDKTITTPGVPDTLNSVSRQRDYYEVHLPGAVIVGNFNLRPTSGSPSGTHCPCKAGQPERNYVNF